MSDKFPGWRYGPNGQSAIFDSEKEIPAGWVEHPSLVKGAAAKPAAAAKTEPTKAAPAAKAPATGEELDADGHVYDAALHAATKSKTKAGLWRMKVGVARPDPKPGYPLDL
jgi:hypothetical protein